MKKIKIIWILLLILGSGLLLLGIFLTIVSTIQNRSSKLENSNDTKEDRPSIDYSKLNVTEEEAIKFFTGQYSKEEECLFFQKLIEPSKREGYSYECLDLPDNNPTYLIYEISNAQQIANVYSVYKESLSLSILPMKVSEKSVDNN